MIQVPIKSHDSAFVVTIFVKSLHYTLIGH